MTTTTKRRPKKLTKRQMEISNWIITEHQRTGHGVAMREIGAAFNIKSPNGVKCHVDSLAKKGVIRHTPGISRGIVPAEKPSCCMCRARLIKIAAEIELQQGIDMKGCNLLVPQETLDRWLRIARGE